MIYVSVRPGRHSFRLVEESGEFVVNIPSSDLLEKVDLCGTVSGKNMDKWEICGFTPCKSIKVRTPGISECPVRFEATVICKMKTKSHVAFFAKVVACSADEKVLKGKKETIRDIDWDKVKSLIGTTDGYHSLGSRLGTFYASSKKLRAGVRSC